MFKKLLFLFPLLLLITSRMGYAQELPERSSTLVTDYTNTLSADEKQQLENKLVAFNDSTSTQIAVVLMRSTGNYDIAEYAVKLGRAWGVGQKGKNNGVVLLAALDDRKVTIQTGYGAEGSVTDAVTQQIIQRDIKPNFKQENYYAGLDAATDHIIQYIKGEYKADPNDAPKARKKRKSGGSSAAVIVIVIVVFLIIFRNRGGGGGGQVIGRRGSASPFWWFLAGNMLGGSGRSSGGWGGGSGGGGGFGGFGGGSFGGGGSSGSW
jgi:uncharacterized protein